MKLLLAAAAALLPVVAAKNGPSCNDTKPFAIPYGNVTVIETPSTIYAPHKSLGVLFGSARKLLAMGFGTTSNSSFVPDSDLLCNPGDPELKRCIFWRGGVFSPKESKTWAKDSRTENYNGSASNQGWDYLNAEQYAALGDDPLTQFTRGWDTVDLGDKTLLSYPFSIIENASFPFGTGMVGLATDSVFLRSAVASRISPSRSWGFHFGFSGDNDEAGELVVGGYNTAKANYKDFTNYTVFPDKTKPCPLQVNVESMIWGSKNLMEGQSNFMACLEPAYWTMILPRKVQENWNNTLINEHNYAFWEMTWEYFKYNNTANSRFPDGDLEITLNKGFTVKIPRTELMETAKAINGTAGGWINQPNQIQTKIGTAGFLPGVEPKLPFLGGPFLSQVYLAVDYENNVFSLANIKRDSSTGSGLRQLGCDSPADKKKGASNTGKIVGGAFGGVVGVAAIAGLIFFFYRKRRKVPTYTPAATEEKKDGIGEDTRYTSPFSQSTGYPPPPPPESVTSTGSPYPTYSSHYSGTNTLGVWSGATSPSMQPQHLAAYDHEGAVMLPSSNLDPVELDSGRPHSQYPGSPHPGSPPGSPQQQHYVPYDTPHSPPPPPHSPPPPLSYQQLSQQQYHVPYNSPQTPHPPQSLRPPATATTVDENRYDPGE